MRIQRPSTRSWLTALNDCDPPLTCMTAKVLPCVGRIAPMDSGIQSICVFVDSGHRTMTFGNCTRHAPPTILYGRAVPAPWDDPAARHPVGVALRD